MSLFVLGFLGFAFLAAPSIVSHTGIARSILVSQAASYGWQASVESISVGWITPLSIKNAAFVGPSGNTKLEVARADSSLTAVNLIRFNPADLGELSLRGVKLDCAVDQGQSSIEADLAKLLEPSDSESATVRTSVLLQECSVVARDSATQKTWTIKQANAKVNVDGDRVTGEFAGVVGEPSGSEGSIQSQFVWHDGATESADQLSDWELSLEANSFPVSTADLIARRIFTDSDSTPLGSSGEATGRVRVLGKNQNGVRLEIGDLQLRNFQSTLPLSKPQRWQNNLATLNGQVDWSEGRLFGNDLSVTTDFASAELDGSFPTSISFVGTHDNPLLWMQSLQGMAKLNVDLAALSEALPGLLPIRDDATLVSGTATAILRNQRATDDVMPRTELSLKTRSIRARSGGRIVVIEPLSLDATVSDQDGSLLAEQFSLSSSFAEASGSGMLRGGQAQFSVDFGRLYTMLRPVIDLSEFSLGGNADGNIRWSVSSADGSDQWELSGSGEAKQLLVTLPGGHRFKRSIVQSSLTAKGNWAGNQLQRLSQAEFALGSGGVLFKAQLTEPVTQPTQESSYPVRMEIDGRMENLSESLGPWLPEQLASAEGRISGTAIAQLNRYGGIVSKADLEMLQPRINYQDRWYSQPKLTLHFGGSLDLTAGTLSTPSTTIVGESISLAIRGEALPEKTNLEIAWKADLEGIQDSIGATIARAAAIPTVRPIGYRPVEEDSYRYAGICNGKFTITGGPDQWHINSELSGENLKILRQRLSGINPPGTSAGAFPVTPSLDGRYANNGLQPNGSRAADTSVVWSEPRMKISGPLTYKADLGQIELGTQQVACDWFAGSLAGMVDFSGDDVAIELSGPSRTKLDALAARLSEYFEASINANGVHESELALTVNVPAQGETTYALQTDVGWQECDIAGVRLGASKLPLHVTQERVRINKATVPVIDIAPAIAGAAATVSQADSNATATLALTVDLTKPQTAIQFDPGTSIKSLRISPQAAASWLKYLTPLAAGATQIDGVVSAEFDEAIIYPDDPTQSTIRGNLEIGHVTLSSGPLANQLIQGVRQIKSMTRLTGGQVEPVAPKTLIEMPPQTVPFALANGVVAHQRMYFKVDNAEVMTSGQVGLDSQVALVAQVPLNARWLGSDLQGLAGQNLAFPINGTISRPRLDETAVRRVMAELVPRAGAEVIQNRLDGLIQKQLGDQVDQLNSSLEKIFNF
ncbi:hypothetical protein LOC67_02525 [Stieleria sp. JC731]|nr:hypothetical protein [Stieleria sp. JC731]MCC9599420.1 hypothetical protein [Stieleria sp. JC731]